MVGGQLRRNPELPRNRMRNRWSSAHAALEEREQLDGAARPDL